MSFRPRTKQPAPKTAHLTVNEFQALVNGNPPTKDLTDVQMIMALEQRGWVVKKPANH